MIVDDRSGRAVETWTGPQVAWTMARGIPGQFGRAVNAPWVWIGLCVLFVAPFLRRPLRLLHLDLAVLLAFSVSYAFFGAANLDVSVPLAYPLLAYLLARMLWSAFRRPHSDSGPLQLAAPDQFLLLATVFLVGFRLVLNVTNGNVIDVGYASVIGADRLLDLDAVYGAFPADNAFGDTYAPITYLAYAPFVAVFGWGGTWDDLPAAHAAAVAFDLACVGGMWVAGRRLGGRSLGLLLAYLWVACPFTLLVVNSGSNDALVAALVLAAFLCLARPTARGALAALAGLTKFAPLALAPLFVTYGRRPLRSLAAATAVIVVALLLVALGPGGLERFWDRTLGFQAGRSSPFSIWGLYRGLDAVQAAFDGRGRRARRARGVHPSSARRGDSGGARRGRVDRAPAHGHALVLSLYRLVPAASADRAARATGRHGTGRSTGSIDCARPSGPQRISTALIQGSSSAGS